MRTAYYRNETLLFNLQHLLHKINFILFKINLLITTHFLDRCFKKGII